MTSLPSNILPNWRWEALRWLDHSVDVALQSAKDAEERCPEYAIDTLVIRHLNIAKSAVELMFEKEREGKKDE
jgi:hypothetical protein